MHSHNDNHDDNPPGINDVIRANDIGANYHVAGDYVLVRADDLYQLSRWLDNDDRTDALYVAAHRLFYNAPGTTVVPAVD